MEVKYGIQPGLEMLMVKEEFRHGTYTCDEEAEQRASQCRR